MTGLDAVSRASYLTKENLFLSQFGRTSEPPWHPARGAIPGRPERGHDEPEHTARLPCPGTVNYGLLLAGAVIPMIPCVVVYVSLQRYRVRGLVSGALKG
jgi:hypothetical protein